MEPIKDTQIEVFFFSEAWQKKAAFFCPLGEEKKTPPKALLLFFNFFCLGRFWKVKYQKQKWHENLIFIEHWTAFHKSHLQDSRRGKKLQQTNYWSVNFTSEKYIFSVNIVRQHLNLTRKRPKRPRQNNFDRT